MSIHLPLTRQETSQFPIMTSPYPELESCGKSAVGTVREENQDSFRLPARPDSAGSDGTGLLFGLADGMGGFSLGSLASQMALDILYRTYHDMSPGKVLSSLRSGIEAANLRVYQEALRQGVGRMGTTLTAVSFNQRMLSMAHVGDSRVYLVRDGRSTCLTNDHTMVGDLVRMKVLSSDKVRTHAQRSLLTKAVGLNLFIQPDLSQQELREDDCLILCSDGVWTVIDDDEFASLSDQTREVERLCQDLINLAIERKTDDNVSVIAIRVHHLPPGGAPGGGVGKWLPFLRRKSRAS